MKYIIFINTCGGTKIPFLFPETETYQQVASVFKESTLKPHSAGKVDLTDSENIFCHGNAIELGLKPTPDDEAIITNAMKETDLR